MAELLNYMITGLYKPTIATPVTVKFSEGQSAMVSFTSMVDAEQGDIYSNAISDEALKLINPNMRRLIKNADLKLGLTDTLTNTIETEKSLRDIIGDKGLKAYQYDEYMKDMRARIRHDVVHQLGIDEETLKSLPKEDRIRLERIIEDVVRQRIYEELRVKREAVAKKIEDEALAKI